MYHLQDFEVGALEWNMKFCMIRMKIRYNNQTYCILL